MLKSKEILLENTISGNSTKELLLKSQVLNSPEKINNLNC
jgi:hypothetical protein